MHCGAKIRELWREFKISNANHSTSIKILKAKISEISQNINSKVDSNTAQLAAAILKISEKLDEKY